MQGIFRKENTDKALKYGIYRHLPTYEKIIRNLVSFYTKKTKTYISQDIGSADGSGPHNGGGWKMGKSPQELNSKSTRLGTYDGNLNRIGD